MQTTIVMGDDDIAYIQTNFLKLESACDLAHRDLTDTYHRIVLGLLPRPTYVLPDQSAYVPKTYFDDEIDRDDFIARYLTEASLFGIDATLPDAVNEWEAYLSGGFGVCLRQVTPRTIVLKVALITRIEKLTNAPREHEAAWTSELREAVAELDALEMPFSPHYDRSRFGRPLSRELYVTAVRNQFLS